MKAYCMNVNVKRAYTFKITVPDILSDVKM